MLQGYVFQTTWFIVKIAHSWKNIYFSIIPNLKLKIENYQYIGLINLCKKYFYYYF